MSAPEFKALFDSPTFKYWFNKGLAKTTNGKGITYESFIHQTRESSKKFIDNTKVDFVLSKERLTSMIGVEATKNIFNTLKTVTDYSSEGIELRVASTGQEQIFIKDLKFSTLNNTVARILGDLAQDMEVSKKVQSARTFQELDRGHVFGFGNTLLYRTKEELNTVSNQSRDDEKIAKVQLDKLNEVIDAMIAVLEEHDINTSDIDDLNTEVFAKYRKTDSNWLIEWQSKEDNASSGRSVGRLLGRTGASTYTGVRGVFTGKATETVVKNFIQQFIDESISSPDDSNLNILNQKASPSLKDMIVDTVVSAITGRKKQYSESYSGSINIGKIPVLSVDNAKKANDSIKKQKAELKKLKQAVKTAKAKVSKARTPTGQFFSVTSLQSLINELLPKYMESNMGKGDSKVLLNYRSGRLAESAHIERMSVSREGMISAFYSYMRNPYGTFSIGGQQNEPPSRDPKLLIAKSIREIAATKVANRMRAILV